MTQDPLNDLVRLTSAVESAEQARMQRIVAEEEALRGELAELDARHQAARALPPDQLTALQGVGADMLWQGWVSRARRQLQIQLARVLARKGDVLRDLRRAHGRANAAGALLDRATETARRAREMDHLEQEQRLIVLQEAVRRGT